MAKDAIAKFSWMRCARLRFANRRSVCSKLVLPVEQFSANGKLCLDWLSHSGGKRGEFVSTQAAAGVGVFPLDGASVRGVGVDVAM